MQCSNVFFGYRLICNISRLVLWIGPPGQNLRDNRQNNIVCRPTSAAIWRTGRNIRVIFVSGLFAPLCENATSFTNRKYITYRIAVSGGPSHGHRQNNEENFVKSRHVFFEICEQTYKQTVKQTNRQTKRAGRNTSHTYPGEGVK